MSLITPAGGSVKKLNQQPISSNNNSTAMTMMDEEDDDELTTTTTTSISSYVQPPNPHKHQHHHSSIMQQQYNNYNNTINNSKNGKYEHSDDDDESLRLASIIDDEEEVPTLIGSVIHNNGGTAASSDHQQQQPYKQYLSSILDEISSDDDDSPVVEENSDRDEKAQRNRQQQQRPIVKKRKQITVKTILRDDYEQSLLNNDNGNKSTTINDDDSDADDYDSDDYMMMEENEAIFMSTATTNPYPSNQQQQPPIATTNSTTTNNDSGKKKPNQVGNNQNNLLTQQSLYFSPSNILLDMKLEDSERFEILKQASVLEQTKYQLQKLFMPYNPSLSAARDNNNNNRRSTSLNNHHHHQQKYNSSGSVSNRKQHDLVTVLTVPSEEEYEKKKILLRTLRVKQTDRLIDTILNSPHSSGISSSSSSDNENEQIIKNIINNNRLNDDDNLLSSSSSTTTTTSEMGSDYIHNLINNGEIDDSDDEEEELAASSSLQHGSISRQNSSQQLLLNKGGSSNTNNPISSNEEARALLTAMRRKNIKDLKEFNSIENWKDYYGGGGVSTHQNLSMIKLDMIKSINEYLELHRQEIGICKVIKVSSTILAIGTSNGTTVIFSNSSSKVAHLKLTKPGKGTPTKNSQPIVNQYNSVTCMDITSTGNYIVCGYEYGDIAFWNNQTGELFKRINGKGEENSSSGIGSSSGVEFMTPIDNIQFVKNSPFKVLVSSQGAVKLITLKEKLIKLGGNSYVYDSLRVTDDNFDRVVDVKILSDGEAYHPSNDYLIVAMATSVGVFVMALEPFVKILCFLSKPEEVSPTTLPYLSWRKVLAPIQVTTSHETTLNQILRLNKTKPPLLSIAWGNILNIFQLEVEPQPKATATSNSTTTPNDSVNSEMFRVSCMEFKNDLIGALWCGEQVMLLLDRDHQLLVVDPFATKNVEERRITFEIPTKAGQEKVISTHHLTYHSRFDVKSGDGKFTLHPVPSFHSTLCTRASSVDGVAYLLCDNDMNINNQVVITVKVLSWKERIDQLLEMGSWNHALKLALNFYQGRGIAVIGLPTDSSLRKQLAGDVIGDILKGYVDYYTSQMVNTTTASSLSSSSRSLNQHNQQDMELSDSSDEYYTELAKTCIRYSIEIEKSEKIFTTFYEIFKGKNREQLFISIIEEYIIKGLLVSSESEIVIVPNNFVDKIIQQHLAIYQVSNMVVLENILLCLEYNDHLSENEYKNGEFCKQLIEKCIRLRMFKAMVNIYNKGLDDYVTPLKQLLSIIFDPSSNNSLVLTGDRSSCIELFFEYLEKLFVQGTSITNNRISSGLLYDIKLQVLNTIFKANENIQDQFSSASMPLKSSGLSKNFSYKKFYTLSRLLILNAKRFFTWLGNVFSDSSSSSLWFSSMIVEEKKEISQHHPLFKPLTKQEVTNCLIYIFTYLSNIENPFSPWEIKTKKFSVEEEQQAHHWAPNLEDTVYFSLFLTEQLSKSARQAIDKNSIFVSVDTLHRVCATLCYEGNLFDDDISATQLELVEILNNVHRVIDRDISKELINMDELITSCRNSRFHKVLIYLYSLKGDYEKLLDAYLADRELRDGVFNFINNLTKVESNYSSRENCSLFNLSEKNLLNKDQIYSKIKTATINHLSQLIECDSDATAHLIIMHFTSEHEKVISSLNKYPKLQFLYLKNIVGMGNTSDSMHELLKRKGLTLDRNTHLKYFQLLCEFEPKSVYTYVASQRDYPLDECLKFCRQHNILDATSYLLERGGDVVGAVKLYLEKVDEKLRDLCEKCVGEEDRFTKSINLAELQQQDQQQQLFNSSTTTTDQQRSNGSGSNGSGDGDGVDEMNGPPISDLFYLLKEFDSKYRNYLQIKWEEEQQERKIKLSKVMDPSLEKKQPNSSTTIDNDDNKDDKDDLKAWAQKMVSVVTAFTTSSASETDASTVVQDMTAMIVAPNSLSKGRRRILQVQFYSSSVMSILQSEIYEKFKQLIIEIVNMCKRNIDNGRLTDKEVEKLWFNLLDKLVVPLRELFETYCKFEEQDTNCEKEKQHTTTAVAQSSTRNISSKKKKQLNSNTTASDYSSDIDDDDEGETPNDSMTFLDGLSDEEDITIEENINDHKEMISSSIREKEKLQEKVRYEFDPIVTKETYEKINRIEKRLVALRNYLSDLEYEKKREDERISREANDPLAPKNLRNRPSNLFLQVCLHHLLKLVFTEMSNSSSSIQDEENSSSRIGGAAASVIGSGNGEERSPSQQKKFSVFHLLQQAAKNYKKDLYGYFKEPLLDMYDKCGFELMLYHSINRLLESDGFWLHRRRFRRNRRGIRPKSNYCRLCDCSIYELDEDNTKGGKLKVFYCGHALHEHCLDEINCLNRCPICSKMDVTTTTTDNTTTAKKEFEKKKSMTGSSLLHNASLEVDSDSGGVFVSVYKKQRWRMVDSAMQQSVLEKDRLLEELRTSNSLTARFQIPIHSALNKSLRYGNYPSSTGIGYSKAAKKQSRNMVSELLVDNEDHEEEHQPTSRKSGNSLQPPTVKKTLKLDFLPPKARRAKEEIIEDDVEEE